MAVLVALGLLLSGVLTPQESFAGFGDPVVILIAAVFVVGAALENTGIVHRMSLALLKLGGGSETRLIVLIMLLVGMFTAFMSSTAVTAMIAHGLVTALGSAGPTAMLMVVFLATALVGLFLLKRRHDPVDRPSGHRGSPGLTRFS